jgi:hypothetical protein
VNWDNERDLLQNVKCVSPWQVELVPNSPNTQGATSSGIQMPEDLVSHCEVFLESENVSLGNLDLSVMGSYEIN